jgi:hypothetical protein
VWYGARRWSCETTTNRMPDTRNAAIAPTSAVARGAATWPCRRSEARPVTSDAGELPHRVTMSRKFACSVVA